MPWRSRQKIGETLYFFAIVYMFVKNTCYCVSFRAYKRLL